MLKTALLKKETVGSPHVQPFQELEHKNAPNAGEGWPGRVRTAALIGALIGAIIGVLIGVANPRGIP